MVGTWNTTIQGKKIQLKRGPAKCDSDGVYSIYIKIDDNQEPPSNITVRVQSKCITDSKCTLARNRLRTFV